MLEAVFVPQNGGGRREGVGGGLISNANSLFFSVGVQAPAVASTRTPGLPSATPSRRGRAPFCQSH